MRSGLETKVQRIHNVDGWAWGTLEEKRGQPRDTQVAQMLGLAK